MSNDSVCECMQTCVRICFETRLSELLRRSAELTLGDMILWVFSRLPDLEENTGQGSSPQINASVTMDESALGSALSSLFSHACCVWV